MNHSQEEAVEIAMAGHSLLITGGAGTGKTFLTRHLVEKLRANGKTVIICCSTGIACVPYIAVGAQTVHSVFGLRDGRYNHEQLIELYSGEDDYYTVRKQKLMEADVLIVDEVSMLSVHTLSSMNTVAQHCRNSRLPMGGLQRIFVGDLLQLPPVPNLNAGDPGTLCYKSPDIAVLVPHKVGLVEVMRTDEKPLAVAVNQLSRGVMDDETKALLMSLHRPLGVPKTQKKVLFATNFGAWKYNREALEEMPGRTFTFQSVDQGDPRDLAKLQVDKVLALKVGCPVMLMRNVSERLVNGLQGTVTHLTQTSATVFFNDVQQTLTVKKEKFTRFNPLLGKDSATREQLPLRLSFAITIHKAQGMTLDHVEVVCSGVFAPGQLAVAVGRAKSTDGLSLSSFDPSVHVIPQPEDLLAFVDAASMSLKPDISCCSVQKEAEGIVISSDADLVIPDEDDEEEDVLSTGDQDVLRDLEELDTHMSASSSSDSSDSSSELSIDGASVREPDMDDPPVVVSATEVFSGQLFPDAETPRQEEVNTAVSEILQMPDIQIVVDVILRDIHKLWKQNVVKVSSPKLTAFYSACHHYAVAELYEKFPHFNTDRQKACLSKCFVSLREQYVCKLPKESENRPSSSSSTLPVMSDAGKGKVRYLAGRAVAMTRKRCMEAIRNTICKPRHKERFQTANAKLQHLQYMCTNIHAVMNGKHAASLMETERRQNVGGGLLHVKDSVYECFLHLEMLRGQVHTIERAKLLKGRVLEDSLTKVKADNTLNQKFSNIFSAMENSQLAIIQVLYDELVDAYMLVANNEFRKRIAAALGKRRKLRHRVAVLVPGSQAGTSSVGAQEAEGVSVRGDRGRGRRGRRGRRGSASKRGRSCMQETEQGSQQGGTSAVGLAESERGSGGMGRRGGRRKRGTIHEQQTQTVGQQGDESGRQPRVHRGRTRGRGRARGRGRGSNKPGGIGGQETE